MPLRISSATWQLHVPKAAAQALASYLVVAGLLGGGLAVVMLSRSASAVVAVAAVWGLTAALLSGWHVAVYLPMKLTSTSINIARGLRH